MKKQTINSRIEYLIELLGMNNNSFSIKAKILPQSLGNVINGKSNNPTFDMLDKILAAFPEINCEWLMKNKGEPLIDKNKEATISLQEYNKIKYELDVFKKEHSGFINEKVELSARLNKAEKMVLAQAQMIKSQNDIISLLNTK